MQNLNKIVIFGLPGSGKTFAARKLQKLLKTPLYHLDHYFFSSYWQERNFQEFLEIEKSLLEEKCWIIDGNAMSSLENRFAQADLVIYFRYNRFLCLVRIITRSLFPSKYVDDLPNKAKRSISFRLIKYLFCFNRKYGKKIEHFCIKYPKVRFRMICNKKEKRAFFEQIGKSAS